MRETDCPEGCIIGLISDTHGLLRPEAVDRLRGARLILHAGDVGRPEVLRGLETLAPVVAVRGNVDMGEWARELPEWEIVRAGGLVIALVHVLGRLGTYLPDPAASGVTVVVSGHSHRPDVAERDGVLYVNPGSAGPKRFALPVSVAMLRRGPDGPWAHPVDLGV